MTGTLGRHTTGPERHKVLKNGHSPSDMYARKIVSVLIFLCVLRGIMLVSKLLMPLLLYLMCRFLWDGANVTEVDTPASVCFSFHI